MVSLSKGYAFVPFVYIESIEVENVIRQKIDLSIINIREIAIGKGLVWHINKCPEFIAESNNQDA